MQIFVLYHHLLYKYCQCIIPRLSNSHHKYNSKPWYERNSLTALTTYCRQIEEVIILYPCLVLVFPSVIRKHTQGNAE